MKPSRASAFSRRPLFDLLIMIAPMPMFNSMRWVMKRIPFPLFFLVLLSVSAVAQSAINAAMIAKKSSPAVVLIVGKNGGGVSQGTGFLLSADGKIATSLHVIQNLDRAEVHLASGDVFDSVRVLAFDERRDIAIIQIPGFELPTIELGNSNEISVGDSVLAIGSPKGLEGTVTAGIVSAVREVGDGFKVVQTDAAVNPGNSGGPLIDSHGQVIGVIGFKLRNAENLNFAVPINYLRGLYANLQPPMTFESMRFKMGKTKEVEASSPVSEGFPSRWKSLNSGSTRLIRFDGDRIYIEWGLSEAQKAAGTSRIGEVRKSGSIYSGVIHFQFNCEYYRDWYMKWEINHCSFDDLIEITSVSPTRIEGRIFSPPPDAKLQCSKRSFNKKPVWQSFAWIPE
jgi:hypothetical protein